MDSSKEKEVIYQLMQSIMTERRLLTEQYFDLKERLNQINQKYPVTSEKEKSPQKGQNQIIKESIEYDNYFLSKKKGSACLPYSKIALQISHILKKSGVPLSNKQIHEKLTTDSQTVIKYSNLSNNILPRINTDSSINVEKVTRGFWQYKLNN